MYHQVMRTLERTLDEMQYWNAAVRAGKVSPAGRPFLAAHARQTAACVMRFHDALCDAFPEHRTHARYHRDSNDTVNPLVSCPEYVWPWVPDAVSTVRVLSTVEKVAQSWYEKLPRATMTESEGHTLRREAGRTAKALEAFAAFVETFREDVALDPAAQRRQY